MSSTKVWLTIGLVIVIVAAVGFEAGVVQGRGAFPALDRAVGDYGTLITDLREATEQVEKKNDTVIPEDKRKELEKKISELQQQIEDLQAKLKETDRLKEFLDGFFGSSGNDNSPTRGQRRP